MPHSVRVVGATDIGKTRARNEDSLRLDPRRGIAIVADGMGGHPGGDVASRLAAEGVLRVLQGPASPGTAADACAESPGAAMRGAVLAAHRDIRLAGREEPGLEGMGTTVTAIVFDADAGTFAIGHVGDSRAYRWHAGALSQLTRDDTWIQERIESRQLTVEQARRHPYANVLTQCLGLQDAPIPQIIEGALQEGDVFVLCSDGLVGMVDENRFVEILTATLSNGHADPEAAATALVEAANAAGGYDNVTVAIAVVEA